MNDKLVDKKMRKLIKCLKSLGEADKEVSKDIIKFWKDGGVLSIDDVAFVFNTIEIYEDNIIFDL